MREQRLRVVQSPHVFDCISHSPTQTARIGQRLGELLGIGDLVLLLGEFGAGKTHFVKGVAIGLGSDDLVTSPSFVLVNEYRAGIKHQRMPIYHVDLYRMNDAREVSGIGLEEFAAGDGVCLIEWAERAADQLPDQRLNISFSYLSDTKRALRFEPHGPRYEAIVAELKRAVVG
jgi:tRNA threonylcarbamoyladenosine biosynthesis protein TsaE